MTPIMPPATQATDARGSAAEVAMERAELFRRLLPEARARLLPLVHARLLPRQRVAFVEGRPAEFLWVLRRGQVRLYKSSPGGRITTLELLEAGEMFGALDALEADSYPASAEAVTDAAAWCIPRPVVARLVLEQPEIAVEILAVVSKRLRTAHERLRSFAHDPVPARLARALLAASREGEARLTRRALAEASGTTVETAIRVLRRFEREGWIRGEVGLVHVIDEPALRRATGLPDRA
jgi:CRP/FNR family transcriptional regulator